MAEADRRTVGAKKLVNLETAPRGGSQNSCGYSLRDVRKPCRCTRSVIPGKKADHPLKIHQKPLKSFVFWAWVVLTLTDQ